MDRMGRLNLPLYWRGLLSARSRATSRLRGRRTLSSWSAAFATILLAGSLGTISTDAAADPVQVGAWSAPFDIGVIGIHSVMLPTGEVLLFSYIDTAIGSNARLYDPTTGTTTDVSIPYSRDAFCAGHSLLPDGRMFATGGHIPGGTFGLGVKETDVFDPATRTWTPGPLMSQPRWYPTNVALGNGRTLIFGGDINASTSAVTVDSYNPVTNTLTTLPSSANRDLNLYPRLHLLPDGRIPWVNLAKTRVFDPSTNSWSQVVAQLKFGSRTDTLSSVQLPGLNTIMDIGGHNNARGTTATAEIIDFSQTQPQWRYTGSMSFPRMNGNAVMLPDGTVLMVGGGLGPKKYQSPVLQAEMYDPVSETWSVMAAQSMPRMYHSTAVLLPDGRVLSAGEDHGPIQNQRSAEIYSPPYLFRGPRPTITSAPASVGYQTQFTVSSPEASDITRVAMMAPGSVTHAIDNGQRYLDLSFNRVGGDLVVTSPPNGNQAPPGWYMLFVLNSGGVPSVASWIQIA